jgi:diphthine methyl ester acylhydrolase
MSNIATLHTFDTEYSADSIEWNPIQNTVFVLGTYQLEEHSECNDSSKNSRKGRIYMFEYHFDTDELNLLQTIETDAILDQKWLNQWLFTATSNGNVQMYDYGDKKLSLRNEIKLNHNDASNLALSIDVNNQSLLASDSKGKLSLIDINSQNVVVSWNAHDFEAWTCGFDRWNSNVVYSGRLTVRIYEC